MSNSNVVDLEEARHAMFGVAETFVTPGAAAERDSRTRISLTCTVLSSEFTAKCQLCAHLHLHLFKFTLI